MANVANPANAVKTVDKRAQEVSDFLMSPNVVKSIAMTLPKHMTAERIARIALTEVRRNPMLLEADKASLGGAIMQAAALGLEIGNGLGHAYLVPFRNKKLQIVEVNLITGFKGFIELAMRSGKITRIWTAAVKEDDTFSYTLGLRPDLTHVPSGHPRATAELTHAYACAKFAGDDTPIFEVVDRSYLDMISGRSYNPVWKDNFDDMSRKTAVRRLSKYMPLSPDLHRAIELEDAADFGDGQENWRHYKDYVPEKDSTNIIDIAAQDAKERAAEESLRTAQGVLASFYQLAISIGIRPPMELAKAKELPLAEMQGLIAKLQGDINVRAKK